MGNAERLAWQGRKLRVALNDLVALHGRLQVQRMRRSITPLWCFEGIEPEIIKKFLSAVMLGLRRMR